MTNRQQAITFKYVYQRVEYYLKSVTGQTRKPVLYVANYQSIRDFQIIELDEITLLFGPNSAGKSALLDAIDDLTEVLRRKNRPERFLKDLYSKRMNWDALKEDSECLVLGFGGLSLSYDRGNDVDTKDSYEIYSEILDIVGDGDVDLLICICKNRYAAYFYWMDGELLFQTAGEGYDELERGHTHIEFYGDREFKEFVREKNDDSGSGYLWLEDAPYDIRFRSENDYPLPIEFCIDAVGKHGVDALPEPTPPLVLHTRDIFGDESYELGESEPYMSDLSTPLGILLTFFLVNQPENLRDILIRQSRLGPLRCLPPAQDLTFEFNENVQFGILSDRISELQKGMKPQSITGIEYWDTLAAELYRKTIGYETQITRDVVDQVNTWISNEHFFNTGYTVSEKQEALFELPFPDDLKNIDLKKFPVRITLSLFSKEGKKIGLTDVGTGISQLLPVIVACEVERNLAIEQPELHLHPAHQLLLADLFINRLQWVSGENHYFIDPAWTIVETHSEHLILRLLRRIKESSSSSSKKNKYKISNDQVSVYYFNPTDEGTIIKKLRIDEDGEFIDDWPRGFFEEGFTERFGG